MLRLRDYQETLTGKILGAWSRVRSVLAVLPTGGGKTVVFSAVIHDHNGASAAIVHRKEIVSQISCALAQLEVKHRVVAPPQVVGMIRRKHLKRFGRSFIDPHADCGVVSVQTLTSRSAATNNELQRWVKQVTLAVYDEGHHYIKSGLWGRAVDMMGRAQLLFVTATPERADGKGLGLHADGFVDEMVEGPSTRWLMKNGYLSRYRYICPESDLNLDDIPVTASGDVNTRAMRSRYVESHIVGDVVENYLKYAAGKKAIVFANDVETATEHEAAFLVRGVRAKALSGKTDDGERDKALEQFEFGDLDVLINVDLFDEGFDVPGVEWVILARVTLSLGKYLQMVGRGLRVVYASGYDLSTVEGRLAAIAAGSKPVAGVIDMVRNYDRHGMPDWPRAWTLNSRERGVRAGNTGTIPQRVCLVCTQPYEVVHKVCPYCGAPMPEPAGRSSPEQVDGDLVELDVEALAALFDKMRAADMPDDEYAASLWVPNSAGKIVPPEYHNKQIRRHQAAKYRREVLRNLVGWWVGMQPKGRRMSEVHRRFFHRFNVDIATAFTLSEKDTNNLIDTITQRFSEDLINDQ